MKTKYTGQSGTTYDFTKGEKIDPEKEGIGYAGQHASPDAEVDGRRVFKRIFIRLRTPYETLTCSPIKDGEDFARRVSIIESWYNAQVSKGNFVLTFEGMQITDEEFEAMMNEQTNTETK